MSRQADFRMLSKAVQAWYNHYDECPDEKTSQVLCAAALELHREGLMTSDEVATKLIDRYVGIFSTRVNAPTSASVH